MRGPDLPIPLVFLLPLARQVLVRHAQEHALGDVGIQRPLGERHGEGQPFLLDLQQDRLRRIPFLHDLLLDVCRQLVVVAQFQRRTLGREVGPVLVLRHVRAVDFPVDQLRRALDRLSALDLPVDGGTVHVQRRRDLLYLVAFLQHSFNFQPVLPPQMGKSPSFFAAHCGHSLLFSGIITHKSAECQALRAPQKEMP